ncbi:MAG TPA: M48 family metallopeptidase [Terriglobia bacterium]|nr:M48 family metallopeptidase [Terriglobia bacterium]
MKPLKSKLRRGEIAGLLTVALVVLSPVLLLAVEGLNFRPGFNLFSPAQDVEVGQQASQEADKQLPLVRDAQVTGYVNNLGRRLAKIAPNQSGETKYAWTFNVVNSPEINAFALPGGFIYVNRGAIAAAQNEAQIAGVIAHEEGHVVMRHGTHQASETVLAQAPLSILAGLLGQSSGLASQLAQLGLTFGVNSILLRNSRSAESQADAVGTYILYRAGYDPYAMAQFFGTIQQKYPQQTIQFFSDHPSPGNRIKNVEEEIPRLGPKKDGKTDSPEFEAVKQRLQSMPPAPKPAPQQPAR